MKSLLSMKNSNVNLPKKNAPKQPPVALNPLEEQMTMTMLHALQLERTIWLMAAERGGAMVVDEAALNPLWQTKFERVDVDGKQHPTLLRITATQLPDPSDGQIRLLADLLAGQPEEATPAALLQAGLSGYPPAYIIARIAPLVVARDGKWNRV